MRSTTLLTVALLAAALCGPAAAVAEPGSEQGRVRDQMRQGNVQSLRDIEARVVPRMAGMQYLGPEYDPGAMIYRLKFIKDGRVVFVDVDARSGRIVGQTR